MARAPKPTTTSPVAQALRTARTERGLTQAELATRLGLRQRQISDLERATNDPRLTTIQNVARALDLELMLVPRHLIGAVEGMERSTSATTPASQRAMYALDADEDSDETKPELT